jgi:N-acetylglucosamine-6-sulfatase
MLFDALAGSGQLDDTFIVFLGDTGYFFGEHGLGPERRFAYEEGIRCPLIARYPPKIAAGKRVDRLVICQDLAPTLIELAGGIPGAQIQGRSLLPLLDSDSADWRDAFLVEYWAENAYPWLVGMTYKAIRTDRYKYIHWVNLGTRDELDELYDLERDPYELANVRTDPRYGDTREVLLHDLRRLVGSALGL